MIREAVELLKKPSGKVMAQRQIEECQREYIEYMVLSERHESLSKHNRNEAERVRKQIEWLKECIISFDD